MQTVVALRVVVHLLNLHIQDTFISAEISRRDTLVMIFTADLGDMCFLGKGGASFWAPIWKSLWQWSFSTPIFNSDYFHIIRAIIRVLCGSPALNAIWCLDMLRTSMKNDLNACSRFQQWVLVYISVADPGF